MPGLESARPLVDRRMSHTGGQISRVAGHVGVVMTDERPDVDRASGFESLYLEQYASIYAYVRRRLNDARVDVPDVVAEVFAVAWRRLDQVPAPPEDRLWLYGVARQCVSRARRTGRRRLRLQARLSEEARATVARNGSAGSTEDLVRAAMERLRPGEREALRLVMWEGLSHAEAAHVLGCSVNAVALRLRKARTRLRAQLEPPAGRASQPAPERWS
jgi:RNA polymerase sigma factor (sigma-70 family)